jgi:hypothetical protein
MIQPFRILDLPTELIRQICTDGDFDKHTLMALRLTCALTCEFSTQKFDDMCFSGISVLLTRRSLQALVDVSRHPRIGPHIKEITLTQLRTFLEAFQCLIPAHRPIYHEGDLAEAKLSAKTIHQYLDRYHEEMELEQSGDAVRLLTEAFAALRKFDQSLCLGVSDEERTYIRAQGCISGALIDEDKESSGFKQYWGETLGVLIKAVADSGCQVSRLSLVSTTDASLIGDKKLWDDSLDEDINRLSANLVAFDVDVHFHDSEAVLKSVKQVVARAKNLDVFTLERSGGRLYTDLAEISGSIASTSLMTIQMSHLCCSISDLVSFLDKHKSTLEVFSLSTTDLVGSWKSLIRWIKSNLPFLCTFILEDVTDNEYQPGRNYEVVPDCNFDEIPVEDMSTALEKLLTDSSHHEASGTGETPSTG